MKNNEKGRSMIEMLGVLAIAGVMTMSGTVLYSKALHQRKINSTIEQVSQIISNMRNAFRNRNRYSFNTSGLTRDGDKRKIIPENMWISNTEIESALGNKITITSSTDEKSFLINLGKSATNDKDSCAKIITADWGNGVEVRIKEKYTSGMTGGNNLTTFSNKISLGDAASFCQKFTSKGTSALFKGIEIKVK